MSMFEDIKLNWKGSEYIVKSNDVMEAIARIEQHCTLDEISKSLSGAGIKRVKLSKAFASVLQYAGAKVTEEEVYAGMFVQGTANSAVSATLALLSMMVPPSLAPDKAAVGNANRRARRTAASSSKKRTRRQSDGASVQKSSGD